MISPGPGRPETAGITVEALRRFAGRIPILGVCLGHQALAIAFGGRVERAAAPMHGKTSRRRARRHASVRRPRIDRSRPGAITRWSSRPTALPDDFVVTAWVVA